MPAKKPAQYEPTKLVTSPRLVLIAGLAASVVLHAGVGAWAWDKTLTDRVAVAEQREPARIKRATEDYLGVSLSESGYDEPIAGPTAQEMSRMLLDAPPPALGGDPLELELELRPVEETFEGMSGGLEIDLPAFELDGDVLSSLEDRPDELDYNQGDLPGDGGGSGRSGRGTGSAGLAGDALGNAGSAPRRTGAGSLVERPALDGPSAGPEPMADTQPGLESLPIDFIDLALSDTTEIVVPENLDDDFAYRVTTYTPTDRRGRATEDGYFRVDITAQRSLRKLATSPKDVIFIIDTSSSVPADWVTEVTRGVREALVTLNEGDRFNIVLFNDRVSLLSEEGTIEATPEHFAMARTFLAEAESVGYTDVNAAMRQLLVRDVDPGRVYDLVLISDGQSTRGVTSTRDLINLITRDNDMIASIYCVGVAPQQNRELLNFLAYRNRGFSVYADRKEDAARVVGDLMSRLRYPIIKNVTLDVAGLDGNTVYPIDLPNIHQGETFSVYGRFADADEFTMQITGNSGGRGVSFTFTRDLDLAPVGDDAISTRWAFWKLHALYSRIIQEGEQPQLLAEVQRLRERYGLRTLY